MAAKTSKAEFSDALSTSSISSPPSGSELVKDRVFRGLTQGFAWLTVGLVFYIVYEVGGKAMPAIQEHGLRFLTTTTWDLQKEQFGVLPEIWGTLYSSLLALLIGGFFGIAIAIFLTQDFLPPKMEWVFKNIVEMLAAIPSVVYGLWGIFVVIPMIRPAAGWVHEHLGWIPLFGTSLSGPGMLPAALVLSIMILPTVSAISRDSLSNVPGKLKEAAYGLGATRWEAIFGVILPTASTGIFGALVLGFGRALGETMALAMLVGNSNQMSISLFSPGNTLAALLANHFPEAGEKEEPVLMYAALVLLSITLLVNVFGALLLKQASSRLGARGGPK
ncbi:phosphate ABC transporter permease subunit PstC [Novipirellula artificiosorum]|uniref:Phosphate transport system permease protein n=1 Tax=Novipirellula artificiosorum TaxID=2528016 RepID=A0A5C6DJQ5_9BACT|nr:phosphate ABC transporter permease subunit PstC [Novipirellula artificiosorum]TWU36137.1 Phosphate transport system permease protein PstC [Novipirellula artificiosorum]